VRQSHAGLTRAISVAYPKNQHFAKDNGWDSLTRAVCVACCQNQSLLKIRDETVSRKLFAMHTIRTNIFVQGGKSSQESCKGWDNLTGADCDEYEYNYNQYVLHKVGQLSVDMFPMNFSKTSLWCGCGPAVHGMNTGKTVFRAGLLCATTQGVN
jgi:hypothetical protein